MQWGKPIERRAARASIPGRTCMACNANSSIRHMQAAGAAHQRGDDQQLDGRRHRLCSAHAARAPASLSADQVGPAGARQAAAKSKTEERAAAGGCQSAGRRAQPTASDQRRWRIEWQTPMAPRASFLSWAPTAHSAARKSSASGSLVHYIALRSLLSTLRPHTARPIASCARPGRAARRWSKGPAGASFTLPGPHDEL